MAKLKQVHNFCQQLVNLTLLTRAVYKFCKVKLNYFKADAYTYTGSITILLICKSSFPLNLFLNPLFTQLNKQPFYFSHPHQISISVISILLERNKQIQAKE